MSWNYTVHQINCCFEQLAQWYCEFMHRAEQSFRALHERIEYLEQRQAWHGPSDEQVERVLRKILAERFADAGGQNVEHPSHMKDGDYFVKRPGGDISIPSKIPINAATLLVDPGAVPSKAYDQTLKMLESGLRDFPRVDLSATVRKEDKAESDFKCPEPPARSS